MKVVLNVFWLLLPVYMGGMEKEALVGYSFDHIPENRSHSFYAVFPQLFVLRKPQEKPTVSQ